MPDDPRDRQPPKIAPPGVRAQLAPPGRSESWDANKLKLTPPKGNPLLSDAVIIREIDERVRSAKNNSVQAVNHTIEIFGRIEALRTETRVDLVEVNETLDETMRLVADLRVEVAKQAGQNTQILDALKEAQVYRQTRDKIDADATAAKIELGKTRDLTALEVDKTRDLSLIKLNETDQLAEIEDKKAARALKRQLIEKIVTRAIAGAGVIWIIVQALLK